MDAQPTLDWKTVHEQACTIVDLHAHPSLNVSLFNRAITKRVYPSTRAFDPFSVRTNVHQLQQGSVDVLLSVIYPPERGIVDECRYVKLLKYFMLPTWKKIYEQPYFDVTNQLLDEIEHAVAQAVDPQTNRPQAKFVYSVTELEALLAQPADQRPIAMIHCIEGGHSLGVDTPPGTVGFQSHPDHLRNLEAFFRRGVAYMVLAHFFKNDLTHPCFPWPESIQKFGCFRGERDLTLGLTPKGEEVVEKMVELGMLVDVSHCTPPARKRVYDIIGKRAPILASHVGAYAINPDPYNLQDWELRRIAESGGLAGVIFMNYWLMPHETGRGLNFIVHHIRHMIDTAGSEHVGIGTDFDGFTDPPDDLRDASQLPRLTQRLLAEGFDVETLTRLWGGNALRALRQGWGKRS